MAADALNGYVVNFSVYLGSEGQNRQIQGLGYDVVMNMARPFLNRNHHVFFDNFFSSPILLDHLLDQQMTLVRLCDVRAETAGWLSIRIGEAPDQWIYLLKAASTKPSTSAKKRSPGRLFRREKGVCFVQNCWQENSKRISSRNEKQVSRVWCCVVQSAVLRRIPQYRRLN